MNIEREAARTKEERRGPQEEEAMGERMKCLEQALRGTAGKCVQLEQRVSQQCSASEETLKQVEQTLIHAAVVRIGLWEQTHIEQTKLQKENEALGEQHTAMQTQPEYLEKAFGDSVDKHA